MSEERKCLWVALAVWVLLDIAAAGFFGDIEERLESMWNYGTFAATVLIISALNRRFGWAA